MKVTLVPPCRAFIYHLIYLQELSEADVIITFKLYFADKLNSGPKSSTTNGTTGFEPCFGLCNSCLLWEATAAQGERPARVLTLQ